MKFKNYILTVTDSVHLNTGDYFITRVQQEAIFDDAQGEDSCFLTLHHRTQKIRCLNTTEVYNIPTKQIALFQLGSGCFDGEIEVEDFNGVATILTLDSGKVLRSRIKV